MKKRIRKMRQKREWRNLTVWLYPEADHVFNKIKVLTGQTNDEIINLAVREIYNSIYFDQISRLVERIRAKLSEQASHGEMALLYRD